MCYDLIMLSREAFYKQKEACKMNENKVVKFSYEQLDHLCMDAFQKFGFSEKQAAIITDVLLTADMYGIQSHGMQRMVRYYKGIQKGTMKVDAEPEVIFETPVSAVIDGHDGMGQLNGHFAMELAIKKPSRQAWGLFQYVIPTTMALPAITPRWQLKKACWAFLVPTAKPLWYQRLAKNQ